MITSSLPVLAVQVTKPLNPALGEFRHQIVAMPDGGIELAPDGRLASRRDALAAASTAAGRFAGAVGVFQARDGAFSLARLGVVGPSSIAPMQFEQQPDGPIGAPYTARFERTAAGASNDDAPTTLLAIVGATTFASFAEGDVADIQPLAGPVGIGRSAPQ